MTTDRGLVLDDVWFSYDPAEVETNAVLRQLGFQASGDEVLVLLGPSGCGKSSVLNLIAGLHRPVRGRVTLDGEPIRAAGPDRGFVFQSYTSFPWLTVRENVAFGLAQRGTQREVIAGRVADTLRLVGLEGCEEQYPDALSGGMRQRVALARTLANDPRVLLMDEPFGALDTHTKATIQEELVSILARAPKLVVFVTHDIEEALFLGDRILLLTRRPATVAHELANPLLRPRSPEQRFAADFLTLRKDLIARFRALHER